MYTYKIYELIIKSEIILPSAMPVDSGQEDIIIKHSDLNKCYQESEQVRCNMPNVDSNGETAWMIQKNSETDCFMHIYHIGVFRVSGGNCVEYMKTVDVEQYQLEQWILNRCIPVVMIQRKNIVFHGSALLNKGKMLYIGGESGSGKSTLTDSLLKDGMIFAADDTIHVRIIEQNVEGIGAYPLRRLCSDVVSEKEKNYLVHIADGGKDKYGCDMKEVWPNDFSPLNYIFIIEPVNADDVEIVEIEGINKVQQLIRNLYLRVSYVEMGVMPYIMEDMITIANNIRIFVIKRPIGEMTVEKQKRLIYDILDV